MLETPEFLIKKEIIIETMKDKHFDNSFEMPKDEELVDFYDEDDSWTFQDPTSDFRCTGEDTNLDAGFSRYYEIKRVAKKIGDKWVSWLYYYGGGKHGEPEACEWMEDAVFLDCAEEEKVVTVRTFTEQPE